jgi:hypothetical protein
MNCRIARAYGGYPHETWGWPLRWWIKVRDELVDSWKPPKEDEDD